MNISEKEKQLIHLSKLDMLRYPEVSRKYFETGKLPTLENLYNRNKVKKIISRHKNKINILTEKLQEISKSINNKENM